MDRHGATQDPGPDATALLTQGKVLARQGQHRRARSRFARVLAQDPYHVEALLWSAALSPDPEQATRHLVRVLEVSPGHPRALAGLEWTRSRARSDREERASAPAAEPLAWLDKLLLSGIALVSLAICVVLATIVLDSSGIVRAAYLPNLTQTNTPAPQVTATPASVPAYIPTSSAASPATETPTPVRAQPTATRVIEGDPPAVTSRGVKWIDLNLSDQLLTAYEGDTPILSAWVSTGVPNLPTPVGEYQIYRKVRSQVMSGPGYHLPNVEFVSYFFKGYAIHGTYWHDNFGHPMSHGCVNMTNGDAQVLYEWAPLGTRVVVHQ
jgi:lipoprotein-anchoring transpeptidase ErfK/SrfK